MWIKETLWLLGKVFIYLPNHKWNIQCSLSVCFWGEKRWTVTNRKAYFLFLDKCAHNWNWAFWETSGLPRPDLQGEGERAGLGQDLQPEQCMLGAKNWGWVIVQAWEGGQGRKDSPPGNWESRPSRRDSMRALPHSWGWDLILQFSGLARCLSLRAQLEQVQSKFSVVRKGAGGTWEPKESCWPSHG